MTTAEEHKSGGVGKDLVVYFCILALAGFQFVIAYQNIDAAQMLVRMMIVALIEAGLALLFFMHLWAENRGLLGLWCSLRFLCCWRCNMEIGRASCRDSG